MRIERARHSNKPHKAIVHIHLTYIVYDGSLRATQQYGTITDIRWFAGGMAVMLVLLEAGQSGTEF